MGCICCSKSVVGQLLNHTYHSLYYWTAFTLVVSIAPLVKLWFKLAKRKAVERTVLREQKSRLVRRYIGQGNGLSLIATNDDSRTNELQARVACAKQ